MALKGLTITLSSDLSERSFLSSRIQQNGGRFVPELSKSCTHLVACGAGGSMFVVAKKWGVSVVNERWLSDCLKHRKKMDEESYQQASLPPRVSKLPAKLRTKPQPTPIQPRSPPSGGPLTRHEIDLQQTRPGSKKGQPKPQPFDTTLLFRGCCLVLVGFDNDDIEAVADTVERRGGRVMEWKARESQQKDTAIVKEYASAYLRPLGDKAMRTSSIPLSSVLRNGNQPPSSSLPSASQTPSSCAVFLVAKHGRTVPQQKPKNVPVVTPQWIERCCVVGHLLGVKSNPMFKPLPFRVPFETMKDRVFAVDGLSKQGRSLMKNMVVIMGGRFAKFSHEVDFLVCSLEVLRKAGGRGSQVEAGKETKLTEAQELHIPVVTEEWVCSCARAGCLLSPPGFEELQRKDDIEDDVGASARDSKVEKEVFSGVSAFVPLNCFELAESFCNIILRLGGLVTLDPRTCTHFVHEGPPKKTNDFLSAKHAGAEFVSPLWLYECFSQACYIPSSLFPPELKLARALGGVVASSSPRSGVKRKRKEENCFSRKRERLDFSVKKEEEEHGGEEGKVLKSEEVKKIPLRKADKEDDVPQLNEELILRDVEEILKEEGEKKIAQQTKKEEPDPTPSSEKNPEPQHQQKRPKRGKK